MRPALRIAVAGAGTGGLASALHLARAGHDVTLVERFEAPRPVGAGLLIQPTGLACLARLGLGAAAVALGARVDGIDGATVGGRTILEVDYRKLDPRLFGLGMHRGALFSILYDAVRAEPVEIVSATAVTDSTLDARGRYLEAAAGRRLGPFDLVVDATGAGSPLRRLANGKATSRPFRFGAGRPRPRGARR